MDAITFLSLVLSRTGYPCIVTPAPTGPGFWHHPAKDTEAAAKIAMHQHSLGRDVFFAVGTLKEKHLVDPETNKKSYRTAANISHWRCWIVDLDIGDSHKKYDSQTEAITHLFKFCKETGIPMPMLVSSGYGVHGYWLANVDIPADVWQMVAVKFKALLAGYKVLADTSRTSDMCSVLRVVGTSNFKDPAMPQMVTIIAKQKTPPIKPDTFLQLIENALTVANIVPPAPTKDASDTGLGSFDTETAPSEIEPIAKQCAQVREIVTTKGNVSQPYWYKGLQLLRHCKGGDYEGDELAHLLSTGHPAYTVAATDAKLQQLAAIDCAPPLCIKFEEVNAGGCDGCEKKGKINTPWVLGIQTVSAEAPTSTEQMELPNPPLPWIRTSKGELGRRGKDPLSGVEYTEIFYPYDIHPTRRMFDKATMTYMYYFQSYLPKDGWREYAIPPSLVYDSRSLLTVMADNGVMPELKYKDLLAQYMLAYMKELQTVAPAEDIYSQMGWTKDNNELIVGDVAYQADGTSKNIKLSEVDLAKHFESKGTLENWKKITDLYNTPGHEEFGLALMTGFGAPMFHFSGFEGGVFSLNGGSGAGKSTILSVIHSIYGKPICNVLLRKDTGNSKAAILSGYNNLPIMLDEITTIAPDEASQLIFDVTDGRDKQRLNADASLKTNVRTWGLVLFTTTNRSLPQLVLASKPEASGEMMRILERRVDPINKFEFADARKKFQPLEDNYGVAGPILCAWYAQNREEAIRLMNGFIDRLSDAVNGQVPERFWLSMCGTALLGCHVGKLLGLHNFEFEAMFQHCCTVILESRATTSSHAKTSTDVLTDYLNSVVGSTLVVRETKDGHANICIHNKTGALLVRSELTARRIYIDISAMMGYCAQNAYDFGKVQKELLKSKVLLSASAAKKLGEGTEIVTGKSKVWMIDSASPHMSGVTPLTLVGKPQSSSSDIKSL